MPSDSGSSRADHLLDTIVRAVAAGLFVASVLLNVVLIVALAVGSGGERSLVRGYRKTYSRYNSQAPDPRADQIAIVRLAGLIIEPLDSTGPLGPGEDPVSGVRNRLAVIAEDDMIRGVLLLVDSPGGGVTASDTLAHALRSFREKTDKPVVAFIDQIGASGAYYAATATDSIVAHPTALVGSIGVIAQNFNLSQLMDRFGVRYVPVKSSPSKDMLSPFKPVVQEEIAWMQGIVDAMLERFVDVVAEGRPELSRDQVRELADGKVYLAPEAQSLGLIDGTGYISDAVEELSTRTGVEEPTLVELERPRTITSVLGGLAGAIGSERLLPADPAIVTSGFGLYYIWRNVFDTTY